MINEYILFGQTNMKVSRLVIGTWVTGGWAWGGSDEKLALKAIITSFEKGVNFIDTAPVYGFGRAEEIVGKAVKEWRRRDELVIATKTGLEWDEGGKNIRRNSRPERIEKEVDDSLRRLSIDTIDLYQIHWPDDSTPFEESMYALLNLRDKGKIRFIGLSNFDSIQTKRCMAVGPVHSMQPPFNMFEREAEKGIIAYCRDNQIPVMAYGGLCRGLLTGKFKGDEVFKKGDLRRKDPKFQTPAFQRYIDILKTIEEEINPQRCYGKTMSQFALRWALQQPGITTVIAGARTPEQAEENVGALDWSIATEHLEALEKILARYNNNP